jgi:AcrR family transcriptional regulator
MPPEEAGRHRRERLFGAMIEAVARYGYPDTTVSQLVALAGISKSDFYALFDSKEDCFWACFEQTLDGYVARVEAIVERVEGHREQVIATVEVLAEIIASEPAAIALVLVDSLALGVAANDPRERSQMRFEQLLRGAFDQPARSRISELTVRGIVVGLRRLAYQAIRDSTAAELAAGAPALADWVLGYAAGSRRTGIVDSVPPAPSAGPEAEGLSWDEPPAGVDARLELSQRERIMRAIGQLGAERGYEAVSIPAISARAGTSNQTFYAQFEGKQAAFLETFDALAEPALAAAETAFRKGSTQRDRVSRALAVFLDRLERNRFLATLAARELPMLGRPGLERIDAMMERLGSILSGGESASDPPNIVSRAIVGGAWGAIRRELMLDEEVERSSLLPELVEFVAVGLGADQADARSPGG